MNINNLEEFKEFITKDEVQAVLFVSTWCPPCKMLRPIVEEYADNNPNNVLMIVNTDDQKEIRNFMNLTHVPCLIWFKNSKVINEVDGFIDYDEIDETFSELKNL